MRDDNIRWIVYILPIVFILILKTTYGLNGGDDYLYYFESCQKLNVNVTGDLQIDDDEYIVNSACNLDGEDYWICNCTDDWYFNLTPLPNTINNYTIFFTYEWEEERSSGGGGSSKKKHTDTYPEDNETGEVNESVEDDQSRNDTISQSPVEVEPPQDEVGEIEVVDKISPDTTEQKEDATIREPQLAVSGDDKEQNESGTKEEGAVMPPLPWWIIPSVLLLFVVFGVSLFIWFIFSDKTPSTEMVTEKHEIKGIMEEIQNKQNRRLKK